MQLLEQALRALQGGLSGVWACCVEYTAMMNQSDSYLGADSQAGYRLAAY